MVRWMGPLQSRDLEINVVKKKDSVNLKAILFLSISSFIVGLLFFSQNITGNVVGFYTNGAIWLGAVFLITAIIGFLIYVNLKKK